MDQKATAILNNIGHIADASQRREALLEAFRIDPYLSDWYLLALQSDGDPDGKLQEAADYFDIPGITSAKQSILDTFAKALPLDTEGAAKLAVQKIQAEKNGCNTLRTPSIRSWLSMRLKILILPIGQ